MQSPESVTCWIIALKVGDMDAAQNLWEQYFSKLVAFARKRLRDVPRRVFDEEDIALSALDSFCRRAAENTFPKLEDRHDLWSLLVTITARKILQQQRHQMRKCRGGGKLRGESAFLSPGRAEEALGIEQIVGSAPSPEFAAQFSDQVEALLERLDDESLKAIALAKLDGKDNSEIASELKITDRTVRRKLKLIELIWVADE
jgi:RNA polymerase sigma factor (sigma-70 family)